jgi:hypothetical protein
MLTAHFDGDELVTEGAVEVGDVYPGYCCAGHDWEVVLAFGELSSVWGVCDNPECPVVWDEFADRPEDDMYRGVTSVCLEDLASKLAERVVTL